MMTQAPERIWADPPEVFDGMDIWRSEPGGKSTEYIRADLVPQWQPIETAPRDKIILLYRPGAIGWLSVSVGKYDDQRYSKRPVPFWGIWLKIGGVFEARKFPPTHWMPLPAPPA